MAYGDTTLGGSDRQFPATTAGFAGGLRELSPQALETLARRYWKPVYAWIRAAWAKSNEDAKDLTQAFFAELLDDPSLRRFDPARGAFRAYLKTLLRRFVGHAERDGRRLKRGGAAAVLPLGDDLPATSDGDPERAFERVWLQEAVDHAVGRVRELFRERGHERRFQAYEAFTLAGEKPSYAQIAGRLGMAVPEVEKALYLVREEIRRELRNEVSDEDEWRRLLGR